MESFKEKTSPAAQQLKFAKLQTVLLALTLVVVLAVGVFLAAQFAEIRNCVDLIEQNIRTLNVETFNGAVESFQSAADQVSSLDVDKLNDTVSSLQSAADNLGSVDIGRLNETVGALKAAADTFSDVDVASLNALVQELETVAAKLEAAVNAISGVGSLFKR